MANRPKVLAYEPDPAVSLSPLEGRFGVHAFQTVDDAIAGLTHLHPALVLVHLDEGGLELCRHVIERDPLMPVVLLATEVSTWSVVEGLRAGARDVVTLEGDWARTLTARIDDALGWRQLVERDAEAQVQSFMIQTELYQQQAKSLGGRVADLELQLRAEKALVTQTQQQLELQRELAMAAVRAKGAFLANMTHEIHTPLNAIIGYAEMLMEELPDQASEDASRIIASGQKLLKLLQDVLNLARLESGEVHPVFEPVLIGEIVDRCAKNVAAAAQKGGVTLQIELDPSVPEIVTDPRRLSEALAHILDNAVKFGAGGTVRVLTAARDGGLALTVEDEGIGFEPGDLERMLGAFNQIDDSDDRGFGGAGMGLAVANQLARVLGGRLEGQGEKGKGSRFTIWLPELDDSTVEEGSRRAVTVLVVDDDPVLRRVLQHMLVADGHSVVTTANPTEALELARLHHPSLVALDVLLPGTDGLTLLQQIKSDPELSRLPVVMLSATEDGGRAATLGACAFLHKPVTREKLREIIDTHALPPETSVVVVEGAPSSRGIADLLRGNGVVVEALANGGLRALPDHAQAVLVPLDLPVEQGLAVLDVLSGLRDIPVLACGEPASEAEQRFLESELAGVLRRDQLPDALRAVLPGPMTRERALPAVAILLAIAATLYAQDRIWWWYVEDSAISFAYARNLALGWGLVRFPGDERIEGYSNPLWVFWMAGWQLMGSNGFASSKMTGWLLPILTVPAVAAIVGRIRHLGWAVVAAWVLALDATFVIWSTSGLENSMFCALLALAMLRTLQESEPGRWPLAFLPWLGLALTRPEGVAYAASGLLWAFVLEATGEKRWGRAVGSLLGFVLPFAVYHAIRYDYFAYPFPATYYAKIGEDPFQPMVWHARGWGYIRGYGYELARFWLLPVFFAGVAGLRGWRGALVVGVSAVLGVLLLYPGVEPFMEWGWLARRPPSPLWLQVRIVGIGLAVAAVSIAGVGADGWRTRLLAWGMLGIGLLFCFRSGGDWMRGYRWMSLVSVPAAVVFALGLRDVAVALRDHGRAAGPALAGGAVVGLLALALVPQVLYLKNYKPETTPQSVLQRVNHYASALRQLHIDHGDVLDHDMGAMLFWGGNSGIIRDSKGLIDIPFALHRAQTAFVEEYAFDEYPFDLAHAHASTGTAVHRVGARWRDNYIEMPGYGCCEDLHVGNFVRKGLVMAPWKGPVDRRATFRTDGREVVLHGVDFPAPEVSPGSWLYVELGLQVPARPDGVRLFFFLHDAGRLVASWNVPLGLESWYPVERWGPEEVYDGRIALPLAPDLALGRYALGVVVIGPDGVVPATEPSPDPLFAAGEVRFPGAVVELVDKGRMGQEAAQDVDRAVADANTGHCLRAETWWRRARAHRAFSTDWQASQKPRAFPAIGACFARRSEHQARPEAVASMRKALVWSRTNPAVMAIGSAHADVWMREGLEAREQGDIERAYGLFRDAVFVDPSRAWARRYAEELRVERLNLLH